MLVQIKKQGTGPRRWHVEAKQVQFNNSDADGNWMRFTKSRCLARNETKCGQTHPRWKPEPFALLMLKHVSFNCLYKNFTLNFKAVPLVFITLLYCYYIIIVLLIIGWLQATMKPTVEAILVKVFGNPSVLALIHIMGFCDSIVCHFIPLPVLVSYRLRRSHLSHVISFAWSFLPWLYIGLYLCVCVCVCVCVESNESLAGPKYLQLPPPLSLYPLRRLILPSSSFLTRLSPSPHRGCNFPSWCIYVDILSVRTLWEERRILRGLVCVCVCVCSRTVSHLVKIQPHFSSQSCCKVPFLTSNATTLFFALAHGWCWYSIKDATVCTVISFK